MTNQKSKYLQKLSLPTFNYKVKKGENNKYLIFDIIRKKYIYLTEEEWVRQHMIHYLIDLGYPKSLISLEKSLLYKNKVKRTDIIIFSNLGEIKMIIECKAPKISLNIKNIEQISIYNKIINANYLVLTNGINIITYKLEKKNQFKFEILKKIPKFSDL
ncbi:MAG: type I restriction enzyme HsdR N-terminal domain-containing protein [Bacteroidetes bacterium]|nr:type I restriction enzyme HsdR N-terminal domain-containing protein [Bacteroidota bacterium]